MVALIGHLTERRRHYPACAYHYNHTERSALQNLTSKHGARRDRTGASDQAEVFVDLLTVARNAIQVGAESCSLKVVRAAHRLPAQPRHRQGCGSGRQLRELRGQRRRHRTPGHRGLQRDDVRATQALRDWLVAQRAADLPWREPTGEPDQVVIDITDTGGTIPRLRRWHA